MRAARFTRVTDLVRRALRAGASVAALAVALGGAAGCDLSNPGVPLPSATLNFPIAVGVVDGEAGEGGYLLVANSNFDVRYASGSVQSWRLDAIHDAIDAALETGCGAANTSPCSILIERDPATFLADEVLIGSHSDGLAIGPDRDRVYLPVRSGRGVLTWIDLDAATGDLSCGGGNGEVERCDDRHRGADVADVDRDLSLPTDPVDVAVIPSALLGGTGAADAIVVAHRNGNASLFLDDPDADDARPVLVDVLPGVPFDIVSAELDPESGLVWLTSAASTATRATRDLVAIAPVVSETDTRLATVQRLTLRGVDDGLDARDIAFDVGEDRAWVLTRRPEAAITLDFAVVPPEPGTAPLGPIYAVASGPSRIERVVVPFDPDGQAGPIAAVDRTYLVVSAYDANSVQVIDPDLGLVATVAGLAGPFEMALDASRDRLFVVNFGNNTIGVVDLSPLRTGGSPLLVATLGDADPPNPFAR